MLTQLMMQDPLMAGLLCMAVGALFALLLKAIFTPSKKDACPTLPALMEDAVKQHLHVLHELAMKPKADISAIQAEHQRLKEAYENFKAVTNGSHLHQR